MGGGWPENPSPRFIFHRILRRDKLCPGPFDCPYVWQEQGRATIDSPRCEECPAALLDAYLASGAGQVVQGIFDLEFALQQGVTVRLEDIGYRDFLLLRFLCQERIRYQDESTRS